jgi:hypothetical protein
VGEGCCEGGIASIKSAVITERDLDTLRDDIYNGSCQGLLKFFLLRIQAFNSLLLFLTRALSRVSIGDTLASVTKYG